MFQLEFTETAIAQKQAIEEDEGRPDPLKQLRKTLGHLQANPKHPSLQTHPYFSIPNPIDSKEKVFEAYVQNKTPAAYRVFFAYGSAKKTAQPGKVITIIAITPHP